MKKPQIDRKLIGWALVSPVDEEVKKKYHIIF